MGAILDARDVLCRQTCPLTKLFLRQPKLLAATAQRLVEASRVTKDLGVHVMACMVMNG
jgi:hypothetical protein